MKIMSSRQNLTRSSRQNLTRVAGLIPDEKIQIHIRFISHSIYCSLGVVDQIPDKNTKVTFTSN